jgi:cytochrome oxidase Cu insertion factor (SCO1/SenC/PrrC family)
VAALAGVLLWHQSRQATGPGQAVSTGAMKVGGDFTLTDQDGKRRTSTEKHRLWR